jgi:hypothetical protein
MTSFNVNVFVLSYQHNESAVIGYAYIVLRSPKCSSGKTHWKSMNVFSSLYMAGNREDKRNVALSRLTERRFEKLGYFKQAILITNGTNYYISTDGTCLR